MKEVKFLDKETMSGAEGRVRKTNKKLFFKISLQSLIPKPVKKTIINYNMAHRIYKLYELSHNDVKITE